MTVLILCVMIHKYVGDLTDISTGLGAMGKSLVLLLLASTGNFPLIRGSLDRKLHCFVATL